MRLVESILSVMQLARGAGTPDVSKIVPQMILPAATAIGLVVAMLWLARKARQGIRAEPTQSGGEATSAALLLVLAQRERELAGAPRLGTRRHVATPTALDTVDPDGADAATAGALYDGPVHCPACGTQLGVAGPALRYITRCPACARWIASRVEGERVIVEARKG
jgi:hypothetical protein